MAFQSTLFSYYECTCPLRFLYFLKDILKGKPVGKDRDTVFPLEKSGLQPLVLPLQKGRLCVFFKKTPVGNGRAIAPLPKKVILQPSLNECSIFP